LSRSGGSLQSKAKAFSSDLIALTIVEAVYHILTLLKGYGLCEEEEM